MKRLFCFVLIFLNFFLPAFSTDEYMDYLLPPVFNVQPDYAVKGDVAWISVYHLQIPGSVPVESCNYFPDGNSIVAGLSEGTHGGYVMKWDLLTEEKKWTARPFEPNAQGDCLEIKYVAVSSDGKYVLAVPVARFNDPFIGFAVLSGSSGKVVGRYSIKSFSPTCSGTRNGKPIMLEPYFARFSPDSQHVYVYYKNQYNIHMGDCLPLDDIWLIKWSILKKKTVWKYQIQTLEVPEFQIPHHSAESRYNFDVDPGTERIAIGICTGQVFIVDGRSGRELFKIRSYLDPYLDIGKPGYYNIQWVKFDPVDKNRLICAAGGPAYRATVVSADLSAKRFDKRLLTAQTDDLPEIEISPDGRLLAVGYSYRHIWDRELKLLVNFGSGSSLRINPKYEEMMYAYGSGVVFIHRRNKMEFKVDSQWKNTGLYFDEDLDLSIHSEGSKFQFAIRDNDNLERVSPYPYDSYYDSQSTEGGMLFIRANDKKEFKVCVLGGITREERDKRKLRKKLLPWGRHPYSAADFGGYTGVNGYTPVDAEDAAKETGEGKEEDWREYDITADIAQEELEYAIIAQNSGLLTACLKAGADCNHAYEGGKTALILAVESEFVDGVSLLLKAGADKSIRDKSGKDVYAYLKGDSKAVEEIKSLLKKGGDR
ncbi:MAG: hypothetical protein JW969_03495 [Spirochaetales bacterium]|nr:hypothetical protein [Spirochaetales bacterium]